VKIEANTFPAQPNKINQNAPSTSPFSFASALSRQSLNSDRAQLEEWLREMQALGEKLAANRTVNNLVVYKHKVKSIIQLAVQYGLQLSQSHSWDARGRERIDTLVRKVDEALLDLTHQVMNQETSKMDLLKTLGLIHGLIIDYLA